MEFVIVRFPDKRPVNVDGARQGTTGTLLRLPAGSHRFDLGSPSDYKPASQAMTVRGTTGAEPLDVVFERRASIAGIGTPARGRRMVQRGVRNGPRGQRATKKGADRRTAATAAGEPVITGITFRTPSRVFSFDPSQDLTSAARELQRAAMHWTYVVRNRERWSALPVSARRQAERSRELLKSLGMSDADLRAIATDRLVEIEVPFRREAEGWEARILPWEFVIAGATREARHGEPLTVMRRLTSVGKPSPPRAPQKVLYVESTPGKLSALYSFETERALVRSNLRAKEWKELQTPTLETLRSTIRQYRPDIIHLAGFDSHQGLRLLQPAGNPRNAGEESPPRTEREGDEAPDGYLLAGSTDRVASPVDSETLGDALCTDGHRPELVAFSLQNSAARSAAMAVAKGANAAIGFQDVFDDDLVELFFGSFYRAWRKRGWHLAEGFRDAWEVVRAQPASVVGSGLVLWSARPLLAATARHAATTTVRRPTEVPPLWLPGHVPPNDAQLVIAPRIEPVAELNYSLLHNRCALFDHFTLVNTSADYKNADRLATLGDVDVTVTLSAGAESASYQRRLALDTTSVDLKELIHVPLTSELMRSVNESINSSLLVEVSWGKVIYRNSHPVRLLPVDQWRDNDKDGQWLPSFVLPRDAAVAALIDKGQRYVRVLRDDPSAGFDGYQSLDPRAPEPAAEVDRQVQAIWSTIVHELDLGYINPPPTYSNAMDSQRLRTPSMVVKDRSGTCIDLALLLAACCELVDVYPVIFLLKDHAFPGYWREDAFQQEFIEIADEFIDGATEDPGKTAAPGAQRVPWWFRDTAYAEIVRQVKLGRLVPIESVWLTEHSGFWPAVDGGRDNLKRASRFHSMLDIARAREAGVTPLPFGGRP
jgi:hypothetical protein